MKFTSLLTVLFIGLKLTNHITWSWLWVLSPLWIPLALATSLVTIMVVFLGLPETEKLLKEIKQTK